jgi:hypothetical protein
VSRGRKILLAFLAALLGFAVGAITVSLIGTVKLLLTPGMEYGSTKALAAVPLIFLEALLWSVLGGAMFVLPPGFLLLAVYALTFGPERLEARRARRVIFGFAAVLFLLVFFFGFRNRPQDALLLVVPMLLGAWTSLTFLSHRLSSQGVT